MTTVLTAQTSLKIIVHRYICHICCLLNLWKLDIIMVAIMVFITVEIMVFIMVEIMVFTMMANSSSEPAAGDFSF